MNYLLHLLTLVLLYAAVATSLDLVVGGTGLLSVAQAAFFGLGAYTGTLLQMRAGLPWSFAALAAVTLTAAVSLVVAKACLDMADDYFIMATFAFQVVAFELAKDWVNVTQGPLGVPGVPSIRVGEIVASGPAGYFMVAAILYLAILAASLLVHRGRLRASFCCLRRDEILAESLRVNVPQMKLWAFVASSAYAGLVGVAYAASMSYISPSSFSVDQSILLIAMVVVGGAGSPFGPLVGAGILVLLPEGLRFVGLPSAIAANGRRMLYGAALIAIALARPTGILGSFTFKGRRTRA